MTDDKKAELLYAHYEFTLGSMHRSIGNRYRYLLFTLLLTVLNLGLLAFPTQLHELSKDLLSRNANLPDAIDFQVIALGVTFAKMLLVVRYFQLVVTVNRQHKYTHCLEDNLNKLFNEDLITYEGKFYKDNRPAILAWHERLYMYLIPCLFVFSSALRIIDPWNIGNDSNVALKVLNGCFSAVSLVFVLLYWWYVSTKLRGKMQERIARSEVVGRVSAKTDRLRKDWSRVRVRKQC